MAEPLIWTETDSTNVKRVAYHDNTQSLCVEFHNGGLYSYADVTEDIYVALVHAPSVGQYLNMVVKGMHPYEHYSSMLDLETNLASK